MDIRKKINKRKKSFFKAHVRKILIGLLLLLIALMIVSASYFLGLFLAFISLRW